MSYLIYLFIELNLLNNSTSDFKTSCFKLPVEIIESIHACTRVLAFLIPLDVLNHLTSQLCTSVVETGVNSSIIQSLY